MQRHKKLPYDERAIINSEIICYPITNISRPLDMFGPFPKSVKSFVPVVPPPPPNRKSSRTNSTLKLVTHFNASPASRSKSCSKHDSMSVKFSNSNIKNADINRSRSAGPSFISTYISSSHKDDSRTRLAKRICYRANSSSPVSRKPTHDRKSSQSPVAFGRGISKERAFAEEKKKIEEKLSKISKDLHVSTRILRNPELKSPNEVKKALQTTFKPIAYAKDPKLASIMVRKSLESQAYRHASTSKNIAAKSEQKSLKVTVAISSRGREIMRTSTETPRSLRQPSNASTLSTKSSSLLRNTITDTKSKLKARSKGSAITNSNNSLARTNSTYSIDSNLSRKKQQHDGKARNIPITITSQKMKKSQTKPTRKSKDEAKKSFQDSTMADNRKVMESLNEAIVHQNEAIRSDSFFQKLFLRDIPTRHGANLSRNTSVLEKARMWNALAAYKSEPSLQHPNYYLRHARPVSRSKFREFETQNESESFAIYNRPTDDVHKGGFVMEQIYKYDSLYQLSDEDEFGNSNRGRSLDFSYSYHERSNSEPPKTVLTELTSTRPHSPVVIYGRNKSMESEKRQRSSRSPSCRRIQSLKTNKLMELSSYQKELARAQSVGRTDRAKEKLLNQSAANLYRSKSLNILNYEKHLPICGHKKNERFRDLSEFYACLERIGQLECATSNSDLRPRRRNEEIIDYDLWQKVREYEKNERELNTLLRKLRAEQRDKDFLFQPHAVDEVRWMPDGDLGLVTKEKSVENLKELFQQKAYESESSTEKVAFDGTKDNYKPLWRASSVLDLASNMTQKYNKKTSNTLPKSEMKAEKKLGLSKKLLSTLSKDQLNKIKNQLTEIYSTSNDKSSANVEQFVVTVPSKSSPTDVTSDKSFLTVRSHSELSKDQIQEPSIDITTLKNVFEGKQRTSTTVSEISESEKRSISHSLCEEIKDKFSKRNLKNPDFERVKMIESTVNSMTLPLPKKPKKDISFKFQEAPPAANKYLVDIIPPRKIPAPNETESISSEASNRTVIFREASTTTEDVQGKIKYFEEIERAKENVATTIYHARDDSSPDNGEVNGEIIKEKAQDQLPPPPPPIVEKASSVKSPKLTSSQSFTDFKDFFGERSSMKSSTYRGSSENLTYNKLMKRSRSSSPDSERCYKSLTEFGDVEKLKMKFENYCSADDEDAGCHYIFSDSELNKASMKKTRIRGHEFGNVSHITHKYEMQSKRARSRTRRISPILRNPIKRDDRLMPHINIISKTASLKNHQHISASNKDNLDKIEPLPSASGEVVAKIKHKFETLDKSLSLMGKMYTSVPDIRELHDISPHLSHIPHCGSFVSHQYPRPEDNNRSLSSPDKSPPGIVVSKRDVHKKRPSSTSPIRSKTSCDVTKQLREIFSDPQSDSNMNRSRNRYLPDKQLEADYLWKKKHNQHIKSSSVSFKGH